MSFGFSSVAHVFASAFSDLHKAEQYVVGEIPSVQKLEPVVEGVTAILGGSQYLVIERAAFSALGYVLALTHDLMTGEQAAQTAAQSKLTDLGLDTAAINEFKKLISDAKGDLDKLGYQI